MYFWSFKPITKFTYMQQDTPVAEYSFLQKLILSPKYHFTRHLLLAIILLIISLNQAFSYFQHELIYIGKYIYVASIGYFITYMATIYFQIYYLLPKFFLKRKYGQFFTGFLFSIFFISILQALTEIYIKRVFTPLPFITDLAWTIEFLSNYLLISLCFAGVSFTVLLRHWITDNQRISLMKEEQIHSEMKQLKEQVSPLLLFNTLNRAGVLATKEPETASSMLLKLSQLLRYQLYDCNREKVLLSSEITFLTNYLNLEQMGSEKFTYEIVSEGQVNHSLIPPLLFIPFVQAVVHQLYLYENKEQDKPKITLNFKVSGEEIMFSCLSTAPIQIENKDWKQAKHRLDLLYPDYYKIGIETGKTELTIKPRERHETA